MRPTAEIEIEQKIKAIKDDKALGPNSIRTRILEVHSKTLWKPLAELIILSLNQGKFPTFLKMPIYQSIKEETKANVITADQYL